MKRLAISTLCALTALAVFAFHVQMGFSGYSHEIANDIKNGRTPATVSPWIGATADVGATAGYINIDHGNRVRVATQYERSGTMATVGPYVAWSTPGSPDRLELSNQGTSVYSAFVTAGETVAVPTFGYAYLPYQDYRFSHGLLTIRGNPYSTVWNDTAAARTINGVQFAAGDGKPLMFPLDLVTAEIPNVKFYDMDSGDEITPHDYAPYGQSAQYYDTEYGRYSLGWSGNIRISDGTTAPTNAPDEKLVFGDMVSANANKVLYAANDMPLYTAMVNIATNIQMMTWWDFSHSSWGNSPDAMINGEVVCDSHSTGHIIAYSVNATDLKVSEITGKGCVYFTMSLAPQNGYSGGDCVMRCWDAARGDSQSAYASTPADHKAEISAGTGVARFKVTINIFTGEWKVEPN